MADVKKGEGLVYRNHPLRRVDNLIFRKINQFARANGVEQESL